MRRARRCGSLASAVFVAALAPAHATPSVNASGTAGASGLVLDGTGSTSTHIVQIADLDISTDAVGGCTLSITSGNLTKADGRTPITFQVALVGDGASPPSSAEFTTASGATYTFDTGGAGTFARDLYIKYTPAALQDPGTYTASVDLFVVDN